MQSYLAVGMRNLREIHNKQKEDTFSDRCIFVCTLRTLMHCMIITLQVTRLEEEINEIYTQHTLQHSVEQFYFY